MPCLTEQPDTVDTRCIRFVLTACLKLAAALLLLWGPHLAWAARHALVVGNNAYPSSELLSAVNDARDVAASLRQAGYEVLLKENVTRDSFFQAIREFGSKLRDGDVALFYYAGHAIQLRDRNYLIPVDAQVKSEDDVSFYSLDLTEVLQRMDRVRTRANILILDACRDNPFASTVRFSAVGLAQMNAPSGTLIAYATAPGQVAREGTGRNGVYTKHLLRHMNNPGQPVELTLRRVREGVLAETKGAQVPWDSSSLRGEFVIAGAAVTAVAAGGGGLADTRLTLERTFWESVKDSKDPKEFEAYLDQFPDGVFATLARNRLNLARAAEEAAKKPPLPEPSRPAVAAVTSEPSSTGAAGTTSTTAPGGVTQLAAASATAGAESSSGRRELANLPRTVAPATPAGTRILADGSTYRGELLNGKLHGRGNLVSQTQGVYEGDFEQGARHGRGDMRWPNGDHYVGEFRSDKPTGQGVMVFTNGDRYEGGFDGGVFAGKGRLTMKTGFEYEGDFVAGQRHGRGRVRFADGNRYEGDFINGQVSGKGRMEFSDGGVYEGEFLNGQPHGQGSYRFADGGRYDGGFRAGQMSGQGVHAFRNGDRHEGLFLGGMPNGRGIRRFARGGFFEGEFSNGGNTAVGVLVEPDGSRKPTRLEGGVFKLAEG